MHLRKRQLQFPQISLEYRRSQTTPSNKQLFPAAVLPFPPAAAGGKERQ